MFTRNVALLFNIDPNAIHYKDANKKIRILLSMKAKTNQLHLNP